MKKALALVLAMILALSLFAACGKTEGPADTTPAADDSTTPAATTEAPTTEATTEADKIPSFVDGVIKTEDYEIRITDYKVIKKGEKGNEYGTGPVIAFWFDCTNKKTDETLSPTSAWMIDIQAIQDNDPNKINTLSVGACPDSDLIDNQMAEVKSGGTITCAIAYELTDETTPVVLEAGSLFGDAFGSQTFDITK